MTDPLENKNKGSLANSIQLDTRNITPSTMQETFKLTIVATKWTLADLTPTVKSCVVSLTLPCCWSSGTAGYARGDGLNIQI